MVDGIARPVHRRAVREVADVVHEEGAGQRGACEAQDVLAFEMRSDMPSRPKAHETLTATPTWHMRVGADALRMVDAVARPVQGSAIRQIANLAQDGCWLLTALPSGIVAKVQVHVGILRKQVNAAAVTLSYLDLRSAHTGTKSEPSPTALPLHRVGEPGGAALHSPRFLATHWNVGQTVCGPAWCHAPES